MSARITIDAAGPAPARPAVTVSERPIGLGPNLAEQPAIPRRRNLLVTLTLFATVAFVLGIGVTLMMHRPDLLRVGAVAADLPIVSRSAVSMLDAPTSDARPAAAAASSAATAMTGAITLTPEQQRQIAAVMSLADGETPTFNVTTPARAGQGGQIAQPSL